MAFVISPKLAYRALPVANTWNRQSQESHQSNRAQRTRGQSDSDLSVQIAEEGLGNKNYSNNKRKP